MIRQAIFLFLKRPKNKQTKKNVKTLNPPDQTRYLGTSNKNKNYKKRKKNKQRKKKRKKQKKKKRKKRDFLPCKYRVVILLSWKYFSSRFSCDAYYACKGRE